MLASGSPASSVTPSPCCPPLANCANVVRTYLLSDFLGLWHATQFCTGIGAPSWRTPKGALGAAGLAGSPSPPARALQTAPNASATPNTTGVHFAEWCRLMRESSLTSPGPRPPQGVWWG